MGVMEAKRLKAAHGEACNGCGWCCISEQCPLSAFLFGQVDICPALEDAGDEYRCGLVFNPTRHAGTRALDVSAGELSAGAAMLLGVGLGCDAVDDTETTNEEFNERREAVYQAQKKEIEAAMRVWGWVPWF